VLSGEVADLSDARVVGSSAQLDARYASRVHAAFPQLLLDQPFYGWVTARIKLQPASAGFTSTQVQRVKSTLKRAN
jgi:hypothetical protein